MSVHRHYVFKADNGLQVTVMRGEETPNTTDGYGGWAVIDRPRRTGFTQWNGNSPFRLKLACIFDGWRTLDSVEDDISTLERMALPEGGNQPPTIDVIGAVPHKRIDKWVIESLEFGTNAIWAVGPKGVATRYRQDVVVNLLQYIAPEEVKKEKRTGKRPKPKHKWHVVRHGETLRRISAEEYGDQKWWRDIAKANGIRDPKKIHVGQRLRMP